MDTLFKLGINELELKNMIDMNEEILDLEEADLLSKIKLFYEIDCTPLQIKDIFTANPFCLNYSLLDLSNKFNRLKKLGFNNISLILDSNPFFINYEIEEILEYIDKKEQEGIVKEDVISLIEANPYLEM